VVQIAVFGGPVAAGLATGQVAGPHEAGQRETNFIASGD